MVWLATITHSHMQRRIKLVVGNGKIRDAKNQADKRRRQKKFTLQGARWAQMLDGAGSGGRFAGWQRKWCLWRPLDVVHPYVRSSVRPSCWRSHHRHRHCRSHCWAVNHQPSAIAGVSLPLCCSNINNNNNNNKCYLPSAFNIWRAATLSNTFIFVTLLFSSLNYLTAAAKVHICMCACLCISYMSVCVCFIYTN